MSELYQDHTLTLGQLNFHYLDWGTAGKPPFVLLHGGAQTAHSWDDFAPVVRNDYHIYAFGQRGHGDSDWAPDGDYHRITHCGDVGAFVSFSDSTTKALEEQRTRSQETNDITRNHALNLQQLQNNHPTLLLSKQF